MKSLNEILTEIEERAKNIIKQSPTLMCRFCIIPEKDIQRLTKALRVAEKLLMAGIDQRDANPYWLTACQESLEEITEIMQGGSGG